MKTAKLKPLVIFRGEVIHAADASLAPLCGQTNDAKIQNVQQILATQPTCKRCLRLLKLRDKNSPEARTRRRFLATRQALHDARVGVEQFERRTTDRGARLICGELLAVVIEKLQALQRSLESS